ncbi:EF-P 5-aminopentanol modification-associated protein YfmH [uncultured Pseudoflavonifractor sp.]|uniref:EF-P 5-aminopentanol modification-associated protein YfmH n=1 Tax=uncultured Pseudoflavonifractor sp. TaxID=1221379 RepID=UPI0025FDB4A7|nr:pitrilysin family protein [uncultured Pseudoflavonifractor sp.]
MNHKEYPRIGERVFSARLDNGLTVYVDVKPDFQKSYAFFATDYGGMDMKFQLDGQWHDTPAGVAHFLEHKTFDTKDGNALQDLAANGASPNAFTNSAITGYYFESTEKFYENLNILLSFVSQPYYTQESVDKEQGIIGQEIRMIEDDPEYQVYYAMLEGLYAHHPIRTSVAGTIESISRITAGTLNLCHSAFYNPGNMVLCVAGNVDPEKVLDMAREILPKEGKGSIPRDYGPAEPAGAARSRTELRMEVSTPIFQLGWKMEPAPRGEEQLRQKLVAELACEALLGNSSPLYVRLYREGLINSSFSYGFDGYPSCAYAMAGGESADPDAVAAAIAAEAERIGREGVDPALFARLKKGLYGTKVRGLNSFENICVGMAQAYFAGYDMLRFPEVFEGISQADVETCIRTCFTPERAALAVVQPGEGQA